MRVVSYTVDIVALVGALCMHDWGQGSSTVFLLYWAMVCHSASQ
jgi:hypothetical protein